MLVYILKRLLFVLPTIFFVTLIVFSLMRILPGDPALLLVKDASNVELIEKVRQEIGLNQNIFKQYLGWVSDVFQLNLGKSIITGEPVLEKMLSHFVVTIQVIIPAILIAAILAIIGGTIASWKQNSLGDIAIVSIAVLCMSIPSFWIGIIFIIIFGVKLQWLPTIGFVSPFTDFISGISFLIMPVAALVLTETGYLLRMVRSTTLDVLQLDYITSARAKGLDEPTILLRHVLKNTFAPTLTILGLMLGSLLGGAAVIETVFTLPGLGRLLISSIFNRDYTMVQGIILLISCSYVVVNLLVDLLYPLLDPRVKLR